MKGSGRPYVDFFEARKTKDVLKKIESEPSKINGSEIKSTIKECLELHLPFSWQLLSKTYWS